MASPQQRSRKEEFLKENDPFRRIALLLIDEMMELNSQAPDEAEALVDEMLHSIFFLGNISKPSFSPESFLTEEGDDEMLNELKRCFPRPFELYSSQLPRRVPFSCVLDMIVLQLGRESETDIIGRLQTLIDDLELGGSRVLVSSTICVSNRTDNKDPVKYYGVSAAAPVHFPRRFIIAASCLSRYLDRYVAGAVMTYFPDNKKKEDFDGTIKLPQRVRCEAFDLFEKKIKPPCRSCANMFGLRTDVNKEWFYGNCAEVESLSNLFKNEVDVKEQARPVSEEYSDEKREGVENVQREKLQNLLNEKKWNFNWNGHFYSPQ